MTEQTKFVRQTLDSFFRTFEKKQGIVGRIEHARATFATTHEHVAHSVADAAERAQRMR